MGGLQKATKYGLFYKIEKYLIPFYRVSCLFDFEGQEM